MKLSPQKLYILIIVFLLLTSVILYMRFYNQTVSTVGMKVNQEALLEDIKLLLNKENLKSDNIEIFRNGMDEDTTFKDKSGKINDQSKVIHVYANNKLFANSSKPIEVRYAMRILLYVKNRALPYPIAGINVFFSRNWINEANSRIIINISDFEELYKEANVEGLKEDEEVDKLTKLWIQKNNYERNGLKLD